MSNASFLPVYLDAGDNVSKQVASIDRGVIQLAGVTGTTANGERFASIACDLPAFVRGRMTKSEQELRDVSAFVDQVLRPRGLAVSAITPGPQPNDPPDVLVIAGRTYAFEAAQLLLPDIGANNRSISRWQMFERLRSQMIKQSAAISSRLRQHRGHVLYVWFDQDNADPMHRLPPRSPDDVISFLRSSSPSRAIASGPPPRQAPDDVVVYNPDRTIGVTWGTLPKDYTSSFARALGFEIGLAYYVKLLQADVERELLRVVRQHDHPANDVLLVSVNASTRDGLYFPSSQLLADLLFESASDPLRGWRPQNVRSVVLHDPANGGRHRVLAGDLLARS